MGAENKAANKVTEVKGKIKKEAGRATDDASLEAEGRAEEANRLADYEIIKTDLDRVIDWVRTVGL